MTLDPQAEALRALAEASDAPTFETLSPDEARAAYAAGAAVSQGNPPEPAETGEIEIPGPASAMAARIYYGKPKSTGNLPIIVFYHGGGYVIGSPETHDAACRHLSVASASIVVSVDYRLAPEHKFPAAPDDCYAALCWIADNASHLGGDPERISVAGDSAGGNLAAVACIEARDRGGPKIVSQLLVYPGCDLTAQTESHMTFGKGYMLTKVLIDWFMDHYFQEGQDRTDPRASPLNANLEGLPPALVISAGYDPLQDENKAYAEKLKAAGVSVKHVHFDGMMHGFLSSYGTFDKSAEALNECADFMIEHSMVHA